MKKEGRAWVIGENDCPIMIVFEEGEAEALRACRQADLKTQPDMPNTYVWVREIPVRWGEMLPFDVYQAEAERIANRTPRDTDERRYLNFGLGLAGEAGEVAELLKKACFHGAGLDPARLAEELGDVLCYVALLASTAGLSLGEVAVQNLAKLRRRYPNGFKP